jgi:FkbM family methyltransferase
MAKITSVTIGHLMSSSSRIKRFTSRFMETASLLLFPGRYYIHSKKAFAYHQMSFSQEGEDMILSRLFEGGKKQGFYVDVGAHHPQRFSNTYRFYLEGWNGINIDALPGCMQRFNEVRPLDINIEGAISDKEEELTYYQFNEPALNTFSEKLARDRNGLHNYRLIGKKKIVTMRLKDILDTYLPKGQMIDFMNVDVEGLDLNVLKSNNWKKYKPKVVLVEDLQRFSLDKIKTSPVVEYLDMQGYELTSNAVNTLFFAKRIDQC